MAATPGVAVPLPKIPVIELGHWPGGMGCPFVSSKVYTNVNGVPSGISLVASKIL